MTTAEMESLKASIDKMRELQARIRLEAEQQCNGVQIAIDILQKQIDER
jgi:hypothetical protein